jgi:hypothetical protein
MATNSVTLSAKEAVDIQLQLLMGLAAFAEIDRAHSWRPQLIDNLPEDVRQSISEGLAKLPSAADDEIESFVTSLQILTFKLRNALAGDEA